MKIRNFKYFILAACLLFFISEISIASSRTVESECINALLTKAINFTNEYGQTLLYLAETAEQVNALLDRGADVNARARDLYEETPLHWASNAEVVNALLDRGADVNAKNSHGGTPLHSAINAEVVNALLDKGADVNAKDKKKQTPLHSARNVEVINALLERLRQRKELMLERLRQKRGGSS